MIGIGGKIGISLTIWTKMVWIKWLPDLWKMEFHSLLVQLVFILPFLEHLSLSKFLEVIIIIGRLHLLFVDKLEMIPLDFFQGSYDFSKRNLKNQNLHKKKIKYKDLFWPQKTKKILSLFSTDMHKMLPMSKPYHTLKHYPNSFHLTNLGL